MCCIGKGIPVRCENRRIVQDLGVILALHVRVTVELRSMFGSAVLRHVINVRAMLTVHNFSNCLSPLTPVHSLYTSEAIGLPQEPLMTVAVYMFNSDPRSQVYSPVLHNQHVQGFLKLCCCCSPPFSQCSSFSLSRPAGWPGQKPCSKDPPYSRRFRVSTNICWGNEWGEIYMYAFNFDALSPSTKRQTSLFSQWLFPNIVVTLLWSLYLLVNPSS